MRNAVAFSAHLIRSSAKLEAARFVTLLVDEMGRPLGILSVKRIVHYLVEHFPGHVYNLPPDPGMVQHEREGA